MDLHAWTCSIMHCNRLDNCLNDGLQLFQLHHGLCATSYNSVELPRVHCAVAMTAAVESNSNARHQHQQHHQNKKTTTPTTSTPNHQHQQQQQQHHHKYQHHQHTTNNTITHKLNTSRQRGTHRQETTSALFSASVLMRAVVTDTTQTSALVIAKWDASEIRQPDVHGMKSVALFRTGARVLIL